MRKILIVILATVAAGWLWLNQDSDPKTVSIDVSEGSIARIEQAWRDLPELAEAKREARGWRLIKVKPQSGIHQAGLRPGDLITTDFLSQMASSNDGRLLARRFETILNRITK